MSVADAALPLPANDVLIEIAPPLPVFVTELFEKLQSVAIKVAPRVRVIPPPYFGPLPLCVAFPDIHVPISVKFAPER